MTTPFRAVAGGLLAIGVEWATVTQPGGVMELIDCDCQVWVESPPHCKVSETLIERACGAPLGTVTGLLEAPDRMFPFRVAVTINLPHFGPSDINLDGLWGSPTAGRWPARADWNAWTADRYDYNRDGLINVLDDAAVMQAIAAGCP